MASVHSGEEILPKASTSSSRVHQRYKRQTTDGIATAKTRTSRSHVRVKSEKNRSLSHPLGHLGVTYALHLWLVGKPVVCLLYTSDAADE